MNSRLSYFLAGILGGATLFHFLTQKRNKKTSLVTAPPSSSALPESVERLLSTELNHERYRGVTYTVPEWENDAAWRKANGWKGTDFCHNERSDALRFLGYWYDEMTKTLSGLVYFGPGTESHQALCHGGSMCAVMDDLVGWTGFAAGNGPWSAATVQVNTKLVRPMPLGALARAIGWVERIEGRKMYIKGILVNCATDEKCAEVEGITLDLGSSKLHHVGSTK
eukprot:TRINITY_DN19942_c0_g1::TRINITY_DN19942_c0_g1_i1::g.1336::m.1336 TRINITY_DN19942_c0_g1::TRINITY_DN19942_c0_g1_i1::g.1336  ORF type:complete len:224 (-),score=26.69,sp/Q9CQJ0/ACO15_MOUSE/33.33/2e-07,4HBT/PF03061.17/0.028 TRINITY_DN19942_c0_g1_i1:276-947(-)